jgi:hypothetical protein
MDRINWIELNEQYKRLKAKERAGKVGKHDALNMVVICAELGKRGYILSEDERYWVKPVNG